MDLNNYNTKAFQEGYESWNAYFLSDWKKNVINPYTKFSEDWKLWNRGWNTNTKGIK